MQSPNGTRVNRNGVRITFLSAAPPDPLSGADRRHVRPQARRRFGVFVVLRTLDACYSCSHRYSYLTQIGGKYPISCSRRAGIDRCLVRLTTTGDRVREPVEEVGVFLLFVACARLLELAGDGVSVDHFIEGVHEIAAVRPVLVV